MAALNLYGKVAAVRVRQFNDEHPFTAATLFADGTDITLMLNPEDREPTVAALRQMADAIEAGGKVTENGAFPSSKWLDFGSREAVKA